MALLDRLGSVVACCDRSDCLHYLGNRHAFEFINPMIYDLIAVLYTQSAERS